MAMPRECICFAFCHGTSYGAIMFVVATGTTVCCRLGRRYGPELSLSFLDVYGTFPAFSQSRCQQQWLDSNPCLWDDEVSVLPPCFFCWLSYISMVLLYFKKRRKSVRQSSLNQQLVQKKLQTFLTYFKFLEKVLFLFHKGFPKTFKPVAYFLQWNRAFFMQYKNKLLDGKQNNF
jgi:hypothetical protein